MHKIYNIFTVHNNSCGEGNVFTGVYLFTGEGVDIPGPMSLGGEWVYQRRTGIPYGWACQREGEVSKRARGE